MTMRRLRWQGPARTEACAREVHDRLDAWRRDWCMQGGSVTVAAGSPQHATQWSGMRQGGACVWLGCDVADLPSLGAMLAGQGAADGAGLAERLARRALDDLLARLLDAGAEQAEPLAEPAPADLAPRHGAVVFALGGLLAGRCLVLDAAACERLVPGKPVPADPLAPRRQAVLPERISLDVALPLGEQTLSESLAFQVGEVLLAGPLASTLVRLQSASGLVVATGALARSGEQRALRIENSQYNQGKSK